jgi:hypothetical protein
MSTYLFVVVIIIVVVVFVVVGYGSKHQTSTRLSYFDR